MYLLKKGTFEFDKILAGYYEIDEQSNVIAKKQFANGNRKKITTSYVDVVIEINLGGLDANDIEEYLSALVDGEYEYWSVKDKEYKTANFIITVPSVSIDKAYSINDFYLEDIKKIVLEKSSDVE